MSTMSAVAAGSSCIDRWLLLFGTGQCCMFGVRMGLVAAYRAFYVLQVIGCGLTFHRFRRVWAPMGARTAGVLAEG